jgi:parvulin-like peptidyl-prolyl isomerase
MKQYTDSAIIMYRLIFITALGCLLAALSGCPARPPQPVAQVGELTITDVQLQDHLMRSKGARLLLEMMDTALIAKAGRQQGLTVSEEELEARVQNAATQVGSKEELVKRLEAVGRTLEDYREAARTELLLEKLAAAAAGPSEDDLRAYYEQHRDQFDHGAQVRARWMLFGDRDSAQAVRQVLEDPEADFAGLATALSEDNVTSAQGGDMGFFEAGDYAQPVTDMAFSLEPEELSPVFEVPDGWAILQTLEKRPAGLQEFEAVRDSIRARLQAESMPQARDDWLHQAREKARWHIRDPELRRQVEQLISDRVGFNPTRLPQSLSLPEPGTTG